MRVAASVAVHPTEPAFLMARVEGASRFAQIADPAEQLAVAQQFMEQLALLHRLDPEALDLPELGVPRTVGEHVLDEIVEWETQYASAGGGVPVITLAFAWLRAQVPDDHDWPVVLVQGDTGPGNFMYSGGDLVAITDWELAHWGDLHDDLAWILVRDTLERFPDLGQRLRDYETRSGCRIDPERLAYFRVLAQLRADHRHARGPAHATTRAARSRGSSSTTRCTRKVVELMVGGILTESGRAEIDPSTGRRRWPSRASDSPEVPGCQRRRPPGEIVGLYGLVGSGVRRSPQPSTGSSGPTSGGDPVRRSPIPPRSPEARSAARDRPARGRRTAS